MGRGLGGGGGITGAGGSTDAISGGIGGETDATSGIEPAVISADIATEGSIAGAVPELVFKPSAAQPESNTAGASPTLRRNPHLRLDLCPLI